MKSNGWLLGLLAVLALAPACGSSNDDDDDSGGPHACPVPDFENTGSFSVETNVVYDTAGGEDLVADLYLPDGPGPHPGLVMIHGGGWVGGDKADLRRASEHYAEGGISVMNINYRLGPGTKITGIIRDAVCAGRWANDNAQSRMNADPQCIGVMGGSAGAHLTDMVAINGDNERWLFGCDEVSAPAADMLFAVPYYAPHDLVVTLETFPGADALYEQLAEPDDIVTDFSPIEFVENHPDVDFFLTHGTADPLVGLEQSQDFHDALLAAGHGSELYVVEGAGHGYLSTGFDLAYNQEVLPHIEAWIVEQFTEGRP